MKHRGYKTIVFCSEHSFYTAKHQSLVLRLYNYFIRFMKIQHEIAQNMVLLED
jgi:hypothetical protein